MGKKKAKGPTVGDVLRAVGLIGRPRGLSPRTGRGVMTRRQAQDKATRALGAAEFKAQKRRAHRG